MVRADRNAEMCDREAEGLKRVGDACAPLGPGRDCRAMHFLSLGMTGVAQRGELIQPYCCTYPKRQSLSEMLIQVVLNWRPLQ